MSYNYNSFNFSNNNSANNSSTNINDLSNRISKLDSIVYNIINRFTSRAEFGYKKYKTNMDRSDLTIIQWIDHSIEEKMDDIIYMEKIKKELINKNLNDLNLDNNNNLNNNKRNNSFDDVKFLFNNLFAFNNGNKPSEK